MTDFIICAFISLFTTIYLINPYLNILKEYWGKQGYGTLEINNTYALFCAAAYIGVGMSVYAVIAIFKFLLKKLP